MFVLRRAVYVPVDIDAVASVSVVTHTGVFIDQSVVVVSVESSLFPVLELAGDLDCTVVIFGSWCLDLFGARRSKHFEELKSRGTAWCSLRRPHNAG